MGQPATPLVQLAEGYSIHRNRALEDDPLAEEVGKTSLVHTKVVRSRYQLHIWPAAENRAWATNINL
jgi:hypothetical protein